MSEIQNGTILKREKLQQSKQYCRGEKVKIFTVKGKKYILNEVKHKNGETELKLVPFDEKIYKSLISKIIKPLSKALDKKQFLKEVLSDLEYEHLLKIQTQLKKTIKPKARRGCYYLEVGNCEIPIKEGM